MATAIQSGTAIVPKILEGSSAEELRLAVLETENLDRLVIAVPKDRRGETVKEVFRRVGKLIPHLMEIRQQKTLETLVETLLPDMEPPRAAYELALMEIAARREILTSGDFVTANQIAELAKYSESNKSTQPNRWKREGRIFAIRFKGIDHFPFYALDPSRSFRPYPAVAEVLKILSDRDPWSIAFWFAGLNGYLHGRAPKDVLARNPQSVIQAAIAEAEGIQHG
jgi:hypothetical protein